MAEITETYTVETIGTGREDYSNSVELTPIPQIRGYQEQAEDHILFEDVPADGGTDTYDSDEYDYSHFIFDVMLTASAHVLIGLSIYSLPDLTYVYQGMGYQKIRQKISSSYPVSQIRVVVTNYGDVDVDMYYWHGGVKGIEKIESIEVISPVG